MHFWSGFKKSKSRNKGHHSKIKHSPTRHIWVPDSSGIRIVTVFCNFFAKIIRRSLKISNFYFSSSSGPAQRRKRSSSSRFDFYVPFWHQYSEGSKTKRVRFSDGRMCSVFEWRSNFEWCLVFEWSVIFAIILGRFIYKEKILYIKRPRLKPFENQTFENRTFYHSKNWILKCLVFECHSVFRVFRAPTVITKIQFNVTPHQWDATIWSSLSLHRVWLSLTF